MEESTIVFSGKKLTRKELAYQAAFGGLRPANESKPIELETGAIVMDAQYESWLKSNRRYLK